MQKNKNKKGFTLIEMLVVISIIGLLTTMIIISVGRVRKNSIDTRRKANLENVRGAITMYYSVKNSWPSFTSWDNLITTLTSAGYLSDTIKSDEDEDGSADYSVCACGSCSPVCSSGTIMRLTAKCEIADGDGCTDTTNCNTGWACRDVK